ncbi:hypothetical protein J2Z62_000355 [Mycoplasmoides fastidiosum]|uniref:Mycoplasma lipoprotein C-terminal domain-containing protein n=1 Tax=Mycoplasmoides fastidiosum TaxID=92758 RepID=A0ABU0LZ10_9BACT|nr:hypothetical protein [Mycoplasmoides fastidiosum]MDQ0513917.1 hypothetical protein [Mycoplasmoides fastidiosum]UUD37669.1 hypothetical protein NPA10_03820 [Mycoplasmoides fastidiosum]
MVKKYWFKKLNLFFIGAITSSLVISACANTQSNNVIFATAQGLDWPLPTALKPLVNYYNATFKDQADFVQVDLLTQSDYNGPTSEVALLNDTVRKISASDSLVPSLILNTPTAASSIQSYNRLLDVSSVIKPEDFSPEILSMHTNISGANSASNEKRLYSLPFNLTSLESLTVNLVVLKFLLDLAVQAGATLTTESSGLVHDAAAITRAKVIERIKSSGYNRFQYPESSATKTTELNGYTINNDTFKYYDKLNEFVYKVTPLLKLKSGVKFDPIRDQLTSVLSSDYSNNIFYRFLWQDTGENQSDYIFKYKNDARNSRVTVDYNFLDGDPTENPKAKAFVESFDKFVGSNFIPYKKDLGLRPINYAAKTGSDWSHNYIRTFNTALAVSPTVAYLSSAQSDNARKYFSNNNEQIFQSFAKFDEEVKWVGQINYVTKATDAQQQKFTYVAGGSALTPIHTTERKDKGLIKFLGWLYKGTIIENGVEYNTTDYIELKSRYYVPIARNYGDVTKAKAHYQKIMDQAKTEKDNVKKLSLDALGISVRDYISFQEAAQAVPYKDSAHNPLFNPAGDLNTANLDSYISSSIEKMSMSDKKLTGQELLNQLKTGNIIRHN